MSGFVGRALETRDRNQRKVRPVTRAPPPVQDEPGGASNGRKVRAADRTWKMPRKPRGRDSVRLMVLDGLAASQVKARTAITQGKTRCPLRLKITQGTRRSIAAWLDDTVMINFAIPEAVEI